MYDIAVSGPIARLPEARSGGHKESRLSKKPFRLEVMLFEETP